MLAIKCDRCGCFDVPYINATDTVAVKKVHKHINSNTCSEKSTKLYALCSRCAEEFENFMDKKGE